MHIRFGAMSIVSLTLSLLTSSAQADTPLTLPELLTRNKDYRATWAAMMSGIRASDRDLGYIKTLTGPSDFVLATRVDGQIILVGNLCQPRNCNANALVVVIDPDTSQIYAVQRRRVDVPTRYRFFGRPDARMRSILIKQAELSDLPREERLKR